MKKKQTYPKYYIISILMLQAFTIIILLVLLISFLSSSSNNNNAALTEQIREENQKLKDQINLLTSSNASLQQTIDLNSAPQSQKESLEKGTSIYYLMEVKLEKEYPALRYDIEIRVPNNEFNPVVLEDLFIYKDEINDERILSGTDSNIRDKYQGNIIFKGIPYPISLENLSNIRGVNNGKEFDFQAFVKAQN